MDKIIGLKELRQNMNKYAMKVRQGQSFIIFKRSSPLFKICPATNELWEEVVDFTKAQKGGVNIDEILSRL